MLQSCLRPVLFAHMVENLEVSGGLTIWRIPAGVFFIIIILFWRTSRLGTSRLGTSTEVVLFSGLVAKPPVVHQPNLVQIKSYLVLVFWPLLLILALDRETFRT